jgi:hypothetical protein
MIIIRCTPLTRYELWFYGVADVRLLQHAPRSYFYYHW